MVDVVLQGSAQDPAKGTQMRQRTVRIKFATYRKLVLSCLMPGKWLPPVQTKLLHQSQYWVMKEPSDILERAIDAIVTTMVRQKVSQGCQEHLTYQGELEATGP